MKTLLSHHSSHVKAYALRSHCIGLRPYQLVRLYKGTNNISFYTRDSLNNSNTNRDCITRIESYSNYESFKSSNDRRLVESTGATNRRMPTLLKVKASHLSLLLRSGRWNDLSSHNYAHKEAAGTNWEPRRVKTLCRLPHAPSVAIIGPGALAHALSFRPSMSKNIDLFQELRHIILGTR